MDDTIFKKDWLAYSWNSLVQGSIGATLSDLFHLVTTFSSNICGLA